MNLSLFQNQLNQNFTMILRFFQNWLMEMEMKMSAQKNSRVAGNSRDQKNIGKLFFKMPGNLTIEVISIQT